MRLTARLRSGKEATAELGRIEVVDPPARPPIDAVPERPGPGLIAVCMATFDPDMFLFEAQLESLRAQTDDRWICLIGDDCSSPDRFAQIEAAVGNDRRFAISRSERRLGFYRNFERVLALVPQQAELVALCDHDDRWRPEKLAVLRASLGSSVLVYSDMCLVDPEGRVLRNTLWEGRSNNHDNLASMLIANTITGAATLFRREVAEVARPFPDTPGYQFHDSWIAAVALALGDVAFVDRPLYDYVQHAGAVFGDVTHGPEQAAGTGRRRWDRAIGRLRGTPGRWRAGYFYGYQVAQAQALTLLLRCGERLAPAKRRSLERLVAADSSAWALLWLALRPLRAIVGRNETLGTESELVRGLLWKRAISARARFPARFRGVLADAAPPPLDAYRQDRLRRWRARM